MHKISGITLEDFSFTRLMTGNHNRKEHLDNQTESDIDESKIYCRLTKYCSIMRTSEKSLYFRNRMVSGMKFLDELKDWMQYTIYSDGACRISEETPYEVNVGTELCLVKIVLFQMPVQYIIEEWDFRDLTLIMKPPVFIPRPETEMLVDIVLSEINRKSLNKVLEFCCGSGAISIAMLKSRSSLRAIAIDKSLDACKLTELNAKLHDVLDRIKIIKCEIKDNVQIGDEKYDVIVSNPPYVFQRDWHNLQPEIKLYEDRDAFNGGADGLAVIKPILKASSLLLNYGGKLFMEVDTRHPSLITSWLQENHNFKLKLIKIYKDFYCKERFVEILKEM
ncbi:hypothetical protein FQR65_LT07528 [Abscondita terminalis]|nr:hypothetical protein FQR65_LT07528 [Abscondita terminalis]